MLSFRTRIFCSVLAAALIASGIAVYYGRASFEQSQVDAARERLLRETALSAVILDKAGASPEGLRDLAAILKMPQERLSLLDNSGNVLADTAPGAQPVSKLDNHADRPEVRAAMQGGQGYSVRSSGTLGTDMAYASMRVNDERLLRIALPLNNLQQEIESRVAVFTRIGIVTVVLSLILAGLLSGALRNSLSQMVSVVEAISLGNFQRRLRRIPGREFAPLAEAVNRMAENIEDHVRTAAEQTAQLESILETMSDGVLVLGPHGRIRRCNRALAREFPAAASALGAQVVEVIPSPQLQAAVDAAMATSAAQGSAAAAQADAAQTSVAPAAGHEGAAAGEEPTLNREQRYLQLELSSGQVMSVCISRPCGLEHLGQTGVGAVAVFHDITELMRLERVRRDFVANVSHELRTPLTAIQGYAETLISLDASPECRRFGEIILKHGVCLSRMVDDLLTLARLEGKTGSLELSPTDPRDAVSQATGMCREVLERRKCSVVVDIPEDCRVMASQPHLAQVFRNLIENAGRYAPEGGDVRISARVSGPDVVFRVVDDGPGIPKADLERIFERFYQVERHRGQATTGLGLAICKHIVERHGGRIRAESPAQDGSTALVFTLSSVYGAALS
ncbi:ATP-binding protein [Desulfovibrio sp.]|uniref:sensor histidine kinase n=1 Tax=Desulfovibrio sp. TaxID=885 RepID=UPI0025BE2286|nr:ATP-binding protein [Desulfovibrio sp.]